MCRLKAKSNIFTVENFFKKKCEEHGSEQLHMPWFFLKLVFHIACPVFSVFMEGWQSLIIGPITLLCPNHWKVLSRMVTPDVCSTKASSLHQVSEISTARPAYAQVLSCDLSPPLLLITTTNQYFTFCVKESSQLLCSMFFQPPMANIFNIKYEICMNYWVFKAFHKTDNLGRCMCIKAEPERI